MFIYICMYAHVFVHICIHIHIVHIYAELCLVALSRLTLCDPTDCSPAGSSAHRDSLGRNTGMNCHALFSGSIPTQGSNPGLLHCRQILYHLSHKGSPRILEWVAYPYSRVSSQSRNQTGVSCIAVTFYASWATREAHIYLYLHIIYNHLDHHLEYIFKIS